MICTWIAPFCSKKKWFGFEQKEAR